MSDGRDPLGKRALFWAPADRLPPVPGTEPYAPGKYALFSAAADREDGGRPREAAKAGGVLPPVTVGCSSCHSTTEVDVVGYLSLHVPFFLWRPGRGYTRFMTCPACRRRTWLSASWVPWSTR